MQMQGYWGLWSPTACRTLSTYCRLCLHAACMLLLLSSHGSLQHNGHEWQSLPVHIIPACRSRCGSKRRW